MYGLITREVALDQALWLARRAAGLAPSLPHAELKDSIPFDSGHAFPGILPDLTDAAERALTQFRTETLQYAERPGLGEMREWLSEYLTADGSRTPADEIFMVNGAKHGLELVCRLLLDDGDLVVVTAPTYFTAIPIFRSFGAEFIEVGQDAEGIDVEAIEESFKQLAREGRKLPKLIYNVPDFHNPTGVTMSRARRQALIDLAARHRVFVVEDSPYRMIRFEGEHEPSLKALDRDSRVLTLGTFSKLIAPGLRMGWVTAPRDLVARMLQLKSDGGSSPLTQRIILEFSKAGRINAHTRLAQTTYRQHRDQMVRALRRDMPEVTMNVPHGGYYLWLTLPDHVDGDALAARGTQHGVTAIAGSKFFAGKGTGYPHRHAHPRNAIRLTYSHAAPDEIDEGVRRLASAFASMER